MKIFGVINWGIFLPVCVLCLFGLTTLLSVDTVYFRSQLLFFILSCVIYLVVSRFNVALLRRYSFIMYAVSIFLLVVVLFLGYESRGAVRWLGIFGLSIQFSEILKPFLAVCLASFISTKTDRSFGSFIAVFIFLIPLILLISIQPDLGSALIYFGTTLLFLIYFGYPIWWFLAGFGVTAALFPVFWFFLHPYQQQRLLTFIHPTNDPLGTSYNAIQSIIAVGSGSVFGRGLGQGTQSTLRFLPERHTDFIFATISEGLGFIGTVLVVAIFLFLLYMLYKLYLEENDLFAKNFIIIAFFLLAIQFFINAGMNIGLLPIVGVPLPFVSYGGSSLLSNFILLGLLTSVVNTKKTRKVLEIS